MAGLFPLGGLNDNVVDAGQALSHTFSPVLTLFSKAGYAFKYLENDTDWNRARFRCASKRVSSRICS